MTASRIIEKSRINASVTIITMEKVEDHELVGLHAVLKTYVVGVEGIDPKVPYGVYGNSTSAQLGHEYTVVEIRRRLIAAKDHIHPSLVEGVL
jgi:hypothetical protein